MVSAPRPDLSAFLDSPYAAELQQGQPDRWLNTKLEAEYSYARLIEARAIIRLAAVLGVLVPALRWAEQTIWGAWNPALATHVLLSLSVSLVIGAIAFTSLFERWYLPFARILVPLRSAVAAVPIAGAAAHAELEMLMLLPLMIVGPFFFLGLSARVALVSAAATVASFIAAARFYGLDVPLTVRTCAFLIIATAACTMAARYLERRSRISFLENRLIAELAQLDALTGTKNRRVLDEHLTRVWQHAIDDDRTVAVLLLDVDHFKAYNDRYGHQAGDHALKRVAQALQPFVSRPLDVLARYGGEEFAAILYDVDARQAHDAAERMRRAVRELAIEHRGSRTCSTVTISVGVAAIRPTAARMPRGALQLADEALYKAKSEGRNRVELMDEPEYSELVTGVFEQCSFARESGAAS